MITATYLRDRFKDFYDPVRLELDADKNGLYNQETGYRVAARMPWARYVFRSYENGRANLTRIYKIRYFAAENDSAMQEFETIFKLQQAGVAAVPKIRRMGILEQGGLWAELEGIENARSLDREIFGRLPRFFEVMIGAAEILKAIHAQGVVHGDVKPANVLINDRQEIEWIDFEREKFSEGFTALDEKNEPIIENQGRDTDAFSFITTLVTMMDVVMKGSAVSDEVRPWLQQLRDGYLALILEKLPEGAPYPRTNAPSMSLSQRLKSGFRSATAALYSRSSRRSGHGTAFQIGANYFPEGFIQKPRSQWPPDMEVVLQKLRSDREQALLHSEARGRADTSG